MLSSVPEIAELVGLGDAERILLASEQHENGKAKTDLESIFTRLMLLSKDTIAEMVSKLKRRLSLEKKVNFKFCYKYTVFVNIFVIAIKELLCLLIMLLLYTK